MNFCFINKHSLFIIPFLLLKVYADNLIIASGDTVEMSGTHVYDLVSITNSSILSVESEVGTLKIICDSLHLGGTSKIIADGISTDTSNGGQDYQALAGGGAGAGFGGFGGNGGGTETALGSEPYGNCFSFLKGNKGGTGHSVYDGDYPGGNGGGAIWIESRVSNIFGKISAKGDDGIQYDSFGSWPSGPDWGGSGGGSGGQIYIESSIINFSDQSLISVKGGNGGVPLQGADADTTNPGGGGGGSGGRITILTDGDINLSYINIDGGTGGDNSDYYSYAGLDGSQGVLNYIKTWIFSDTHPDSTLYYLNDEPQFKFINNDNDYIGYFYLLDSLENSQVTLSSDYIVSGGEETVFAPGRLDDGVYFLHVVPYDGGEVPLDSLALTKQIKIGTNSLSINSSTHPESEEWYEGQNITIAIDYPFGITDFYYEFDQSPFTNPSVDSSILAENNSWIMPGLDDGIYFVHIIAKDSLGFVSQEPIRKRFNVGQTYPFEPFSQNATDLDTLIFSYETINNPISFSWNPALLQDGQWNYYGVDYYFDLDSIFSDELISGDSLSVEYSALDIYEFMSETSQDTLSGYWWVKTMNPYEDTLMSSNGPMEFTIVRDTNLTTYSEFYINTPTQNTDYMIDQTTLNDTVLFSWDACENIYGDTITYLVDFESSFGTILIDTMLTEPFINQSMVSIYLAMLDSNITTIEGDWSVTAINGLDTIESANGPYHFSVTIDPEEIIPLAPFELKAPSDSTILYIDPENLLDTLVLDWGSSFNINGLATDYTLSYDYESDVMNSDMLFQDTVLNKSDIFFDHIQIFNMMNAAGVDSFSFSWQVNIADNSNELNSLNGPFVYTIYKENMDIERPIVSCSLSENLISYHTEIELNSTFIYSDTLNYFLDYSIDGGSQWVNELSIDTLTNKFNLIYDWDILEEIGWHYIENFNIRFYAFSETVFSDTFQLDSIILANIAGDYIYDPESEIGIQANDIAELLSVFHHEGDSISYYDIGPSTGLAPNITTQRDSVINFEDLSTFTQMWYWSTNFFSPISESEIQNSFTESEIRLIINKNKILSEEEKLNLLFDYNSSKNLMGLDLILKYDPNIIDIHSIAVGDVFKTSRILKLSDLDQSKGCYHLSLWVKNDQPRSFKGNWLDIDIHSNMNLNIEDAIEIYVQPHLSKIQKENVSHYVFDINTEQTLPDDFFLSQNYPNPFNPTTKIEYGISESDFVKLIIYDITGREVKTLVNQMEDPGYKIVEWKGSDNLGNSVGTGMYFYRIKVGDKVQTKKMIFMK